MCTLCAPDALGCAIGGVEVRHPKAWRASRFVLVALAFVAFSPPAAADAQVLYGSMTGNIRDATGGALAGVTVTATHQDTNLAREAVTNAEGGYNLLNLPQGRYLVKVTLQGFKEYVRQDVPVTVNQVTRVDTELEVGNLAETITVTSEVALLQTDSGSVSSELKSAEITNLP